jgi:S1-C subfamily serine protease
VSVSSSRFSTATFVAVRQEFQEQVRRQILELRAEIERGDSGGPLVLKDGTVGGIVYAEARTNPDVGYALSGTEVAAAIRPGIGRRTAVATGACLH